MSDIGTFSDIYEMLLLRDFGRSLIHWEGLNVPFFIYFCMVYQRFFFVNDFDDKEEDDDDDEDKDDLMHRCVGHTA